MSCSLEKIKENSIDLAIKTFMEGNPNMKQLSENEVNVKFTFELKKGNNFNNLIAKSINNVKQKMLNTFGEKFTEGWVELFSDNGNLNKTYKFSFPNNLEQAYRVKLNNEEAAPKKLSDEELSEQMRIEQEQKEFNLEDLYQKSLEVDDETIKERIDKCE